MGEFDLIAKYFTRESKRSDVLLGVGDDAAVLQVPPTRRLVAAVDTIVEGVHFPVDTVAADIGYRALAVNLSDLAAMGAEPAWMTLSLSIPHADTAWLEQFALGLYHLADQHGVALVGGDTVRGPLSVTVQILGFVEADRWLTRRGAEPGDVVFVSGVPGEAAAGLAVLQRAIPPSSEAAHLIDRFLRPQPRLQLGRDLRKLASAAIDISDGLLADLSHICNASRCGAHIDMEAIPASASMRAIFSSAECEQMSLSGGDDYELLFTANNESILVVEAAIAAGVRCTPIGRIVEGDQVDCYRAGQKVAVERRGYNHFV
ncbi:MAG: thiamine-phosphate kinase [Candidatus Obscuribacterales bacterium]|nr:thiamine-phosphate kinase [Steroidobacteraceae bacterium]